MQEDCIAPDAADADDLESRCEDNQSEEIHDHPATSEDSGSYHTPPALIPVPSREYSTSEEVMKLRGSKKISRTKTIPFILMAIFMVLAGLVLIVEGLMMEFKWSYSIKLFYKPYWIGTLVVISGFFVLLFCCLRVPSVAVVMATVCLPTLAGCILMLIFSGLMADALTPDDKKYFCYSYASSTNIVQCLCVEDIQFGVSVKGAASNAIVNESCESELRFIFELMLVTAGLSAFMVVLLFSYIIWVYIAATRHTYMERRQSAWHGTLTRTETFARGGTLKASMILQNRSAGDLPNINETRTLPKMYSREPSMLSTSRVTLGSRTGTLKTTRAPLPPTLERNRSRLSLGDFAAQQPVYDNVHQDPIRVADQERFHIPADIRITPSQPVVPPPKPSTSLKKHRDDSSSEDNTTERRNYKPGQKNSAISNKIQNIEQKSVNYGR